MGLSGSFTLTSEWQLICPAGDYCRVHTIRTGVMLTDGAFSDIPGYENTIYVGPGKTITAISYDGLYARAVGEESAGIYTESALTVEELNTKFANVAVLSSSSISVSPTKIPSVLIGPVANTSGVCDNPGGGFNSISTTSRHRLLTPVTNLQILFSNFVVNPDAGIDEDPVGNPVQIVANLINKNNVSYPILFGGSTTGTIPDGGVLTGTVAVSLSPQFFKISVSRTAVGGTAVPVMTYTGDAENGELFSLGSMYRPLAIRGATTARTFGLLGDSRTIGAVDVHDDASGDLGLMARAIGPKFAYTNAAVGFDSALKFVVSNTNRVAAISDCTDIVICYTNDFNAGFNKAGSLVLDDVKTIMGYFPGKQIWLLTVPPYGISSTDGFTTLANQSGGTTHRQAFNDLLRAGVAGATTVEIADLLESSRNSGKWKVDAGSVLTLDGTHETPFATHLVGRSDAWNPVVGSSPVPLSDIIITWQPAYTSGSVPKSTDVGTTIANLSTTGGVEGAYVTFSEVSDSDGAVAISSSGVVTLTRDMTGDATGATHSFTVRATDYRGEFIDRTHSFTVAAFIVVYAVLNPSDKNSNITLSNSNLTATRGPGQNWAAARATRSASTGKKFYSVIWDNYSGFHLIGMATANHSLSDGSFVGSSTASVALFPASNQVLFANGVIGSMALGESQGSVFDMAVDLGARILWFRRNGGNWNGNSSADPVSGSGGVAYDFSGFNGAIMFPALSFYNSGDQMTFNFGATAYSYSPPTGFTNW
jgi:hypothetical protein